jgi:glycosyltransferase involved in cell wall biosynthesis
MIEDVLREQGVTTRIVPLPTGVNVSHIACGNRQMIREQYGLSPDTLALIYVGRIAFEKSVDFLLYAAAKILRERQNVVMLLVGSGPYEENIKTIAQQLGVAHKVHFVGSVPREEVRHYLVASDVFVFASRTETQGIVIAEAMAAGLPCVAVDAYGVADVLAHGVDGFLTIPDVHTFTLSLETLLDSPTLRQQFSENARKNVHKFSAESSARRLVTLYKEVIEGRKDRVALRRGKVVTSKT